MKDVIELLGEKKEQLAIRAKDDVLFLIMNNKVNLFNPTFIRLFHDKLDEIEKMQKDGKYCCLVITSSSDRFFSTGLDLGFISKSQSSFDVQQLLIEYQKLIGRWISFGMITISMITGHCYGAGAIFALTSDYKVMKQTDKQVICLNENQMGVSIPPGMFSTLKKNVDPKELRNMILLSQKYSSQLALDSKLIDHQVPEQQLMQFTIQMAQKVGKYGNNFANLANLKSEMHKDVLEACNNHNLTNGIKTIYNVSLFPKL